MTAFAEWLAYFGESRTTIARELRLHPATVQKAIERNSRPPWAHAAAMHFGLAPGILFGVLPTDPRAIAAGRARAADMVGERRLLRERARVEAANRD